MVDAKLKEKGHHLQLLCIKFLGITAYSTCTWAL